MDVSKNCVAKRTRYQCRKAEEELLKKAKSLKNGKEKRQNSVRKNSEKPIPKRSSKDDNNKANSSDVEILGEMYIPPEQRRSLATSQIGKPHQSIDIDCTLKPTTRCVANDENRRTQNKYFGDSSISLSVSTSSEDFFPLSEEVDFVDLLSKESESNCCKEVQNHNHGRKAVIGNGIMFSQEYSRKEDVGGPGERSPQWSGSQNQGRNVHIGYVGVFTSKTSTEGEFDDDYYGDESGNLNSESTDDLSYFMEGNIEGRTDKYDGTDGPIGQRVGYNKEEGVRKRTMNNEREDDDCTSTLKDVNLVSEKRKAGNVHKENGKKRKVLGLDKWVDGTKRDCEGRKSRKEQVSKSRKTKLDSGKASSPIMKDKS